MAIQRLAISALNSDTVLPVIFVNNVALWTPNIRVIDTYTTYYIVLYMALPNI